ncbi:ribosome biogenesis GTPase Der [PVC group bacterium (ex Bugula neritina AB1)]|nr:ribosome biogenesis GTPase Der [PVC group bacterium (ex Bugula neritina AB1)]
MSAKKKLPTIAIIGRPNVGKSSLFNRLLGKQLSIVDSTEGVTRDRIYTVVERFSQSFGLIDTGGLSFNDQNIFQKDIETQVHLALDQCQGFFFVVDGKSGIHPLDHVIANLIRNQGKPCVVAVNKLDSDDHMAHIADFFELGYQKTVGISAKQNLGLTVLVDSILKDCEPGKVSAPSVKHTIAILGRPNVGKSSLINKLSNSERVIVSEKSGTTRDSIDVQVKYNGHIYTFIDTAGLRYNKKIKESIEFFSATRTQKSLERCDIAMVMIDANDGISTQDLKIIRMIDDAGKACALIVNKWDMFSGIHQKDYMLDQAYKLKPYKHIPNLFISATEGKNTGKILDLISFLDKEQHQRISTGILNRFFQKIVKATPPPRRRGSLVKFYYISQVDRLPPTFQISVNNKELLDASYLNLIKNKLRLAFGFTGTPIRLNIQDKK